MIKTKNKKILLFSGIFLAVIVSVLWYSFSYSFSEYGDYESVISIPASDSGETPYIDEARRVAISSIDDKVYVSDSGSHVVLVFNSDNEYLYKIGVPGTGDGQLNSPDGIALGVDGSNDVIYIVDAGNHRIQKFNYRGEFLAKWGNEGSGNGQFNGSQDIALDSLNNVYVVDGGNSRVQKFDSAGNYITQWGGSGSGNGQFNNPNGIAIDSFNNIYITDTYNNRVQKFDSDGNFITKWGSFGTGLENFWDPKGIFVDSFNNIYIADQGNNDKIRKFDSSGNFLEIVLSNNPSGDYSQDGNFDQPIDIEINSLNDIYISDKYNRVQKFSLGVKTGHYLDLDNIIYPATGQFDRPNSVFIDDSDSVYVIDTNNNRVQKFDSTGNYIKDFLKTGVDMGEVKSPTNMDIDSSGNIYLVDSGNSRVQKFDSNWNYVTQWGSYGSSNSQFKNPYDLDVFNNEVFVVDTYNNRIQVFDLNGNFLRTWGDSSLFFEPRGIYISELGKVFVADTKNSNIKIFNLEGVSGGQFGAYGSGNGQFGAPVDLVASSSVIYVLDHGNNRVQEFDSSWNYIAQWGGSGSGDGQFNAPSGLAINSLGNIYISDTINNRIQYFSGDGIYSSQWGSYGSTRLSAISLASDSDNNLDIIDESRGVLKFDSNGNFIEQFIGVGGANGGVISPKGLVFDSNKNLYIYDNSDCFIKKFNSSGTFELEWGGCGFSSGEIAVVESFLGMAVDSFNNIYVADNLNNRIQKFNSSGVFIQEWTVEFPRGIVIDSSNNIFVADTYYQIGGNNRNIIKFNPAGELVTQWSEGFNFPRSLAIDPSDNVYVADGDSSRILKFDNNGENIGNLDNFSLANSFIYIDSSDNIYVPSREGSSIQKISYGDHVGYVFASKIYGENEFTFYNPFSVSLGNISIPEVGTMELLLVSDFSEHNIKIFLKVDGNFEYMATNGEQGSGANQYLMPSKSIIVDRYLYVADAGNHRIQRFDVLEEDHLSWGSFGDGPGQFGGESLIGGGYLLGIIADSDGNIYVTDTFNNRVQKFDADGTYISEWVASYPFGIAIDQDSNIFTSSPFANIIEKFNSDGQKIAEFGGPGSENGQFNLAAGLFVDFNNYLYVADAGNDRIQKFDTSGNFIDKWGEAGSELGEFNNPLDVVVDNDGDIFVADSENKRVQILYISAQKPYDLAVSNSTSNSLTISWQGNTYNYYIENITNSDASGWIQNNSYTFSNLTCGENYSFRVKGKTYSGEETDWSDVLSYSITCLDPDPDPDPDQDPDNSSINYSSGLPLPICKEIEYNDWEACRQGFSKQFRSIKKTEPANCYLSIEQRQIMERPCSIADYGEGQKIVENDKFENIDQGYLLNIRNITLREKSLVSKIDNRLVNRLKGFILLQKENYGELWYVNPVDNLKYYMGNSLATFNIMRGFGLGVSNKDFDFFEKNGVPDKLLGRIILKVESHGEAYYINPITREMHYLSRPHEAFEIFKKLALGINNINIRKIEVGIQ